MPKTTHPAVYRIGQFFVAVKAYLPSWAGGVGNQLSAKDAALVKSILPTAPQQQLFAQMSPNDQRHALAVGRTLQQAGYNQPALMQAALLHDVGKSLGQPIVHRVLIVLFNAFWPGALQWLSTEITDDERRMTNENSSFIIKYWRGPFIIHARHPAIGAEWAANAKCDPLAVSLIQKHQDEPGDVSIEENKLLAALQWADNLN